MDTSKIEASLDAASYMLFEHKKKQHLKKEVMDIPERMENPF